MKSADSPKMSSFPRQPLVYVLVLNYNNWSDTNECLASLQGLEYQRLHILVLDNGSMDGSVQTIRERFPSIEIIALAENLGFAKANNLGIRAALERDADYVWLLNNDTRVDPRALAAMVRKAESDLKIGAVGSAIYSMAEPESLQAWGGGYVSLWSGRSRHFHDPVPDQRIQYLTGASLLLRRSVLESVGFLDEGFFFYGEDADYCFRMRRAGWRLAVAADSKVWHKQMATIDSRSFYAEFHCNKGAVRFFRKHAALPFVPVCLRTALRMAKVASTADWKRMWAIWKAICRDGGTETWN
jgi:GT2 family glycosyltransferase